MRNMRSPLKDPPLRNPGQSLDEQIYDLIYDYMLWPAIFALFFLILAGLEWFRYLRTVPPSPAIYSFGAVIALAFAAHRISKALLRLSALKLGRHGEKEVGQSLEQLRERGHVVFHDIPGTEFNVDHVLIGPAGVFTVETKTYSKSLTRKSKVIFDGETILVDGHKPDRDVLGQANAQATWLSEVLRKSTGRHFHVRPVIVYPGWFVKQAGSRNKDIWVLNPKALPAFLDHEPSRLCSEDVSLVSSHLDRFIRTSAQ